LTVRLIADFDKEPEFEMKKKILIMFLTSCLVIPVNAMAREFLDSFMHINLGLMMGFNSGGDLITYEQDLGSVTGTGEDGSTGEVRPDYEKFGLTLTLDICPFSPVLIAHESHALKFGIRSSLGYRSLSRSLVVEVDGVETDYGGDSLNYMNWMIGPVVHYAPWLDVSRLSGEYTAGGGFTLFVLFGQVFNGELNSFHVVREREGSTGSPVSDFSGFSINMGIGGELSICSVNMGTNVYYSIVKMNLDNTVYSGMDKQFDLNGFNIELYVGITVDFI